MFPSFPALLPPGFAIEFYLWSELKHLNTRFPAPFHFHTPSAGGRKILTEAEIPLIFRIILIYAFFFGGVGVGGVISAISVDDDSLGDNNEKP